MVTLTLIAVIVSDCAPDMPSTVAVTTTVPVASVCTSPVVEPTATFESELTDVAVAPGTMLPNSSHVVAVS